MSRSVTEFVWVRINGEAVLIERSTNRRGRVWAAPVGEPSAPAKIITQAVEAAKDRSTPNAGRTAGPD